METKNVTTETTEEQILKNANDELRQFTGSEQFYRYILGLKLTEGVKHAADTFRCFWFLDVIASYQGQGIYRAEEFQVWNLKRTEGDRFIVTSDDGNNNILGTQKIPFSDFPYDTFTVWLVNGVIMLPTEY